MTTKFGFLPVADAVRICVVQPANINWAAALSPVILKKSLREGMMFLPWLTFVQ